MATIAYKDGILAADSSLNYQNAKLGDVKKVTKRDDGARAAFSGSIGQAYSFFYLFHGSKQNDFKFENNTDEAVVIHSDGTIWIYESGGFYQLLTDIYAGGSGFQFALGAMKAGASAVEAVQIAMELDVYTSGEVVTI